MIPHPSARASLTPVDDAGRFRLSGTVGFGTAMPLLEKSRELFKDVPDVRVNFADVERFNSAGVALLIEWLRWARRGKRGLLFEALPEEALAMARICEVESLLAPALEAPPANP
jgi:phospholipid transport system transporter-binding protein